jgi:hypothetical protein
MGGLGQACLIFFLLYFGRKKFSKRKRASPAEWRGERKSEAAAAIPFPLKPLFLAAAADANDRKFGF